MLGNCHGLYLLQLPFAHKGAHIWVGQFLNKPLHGFYACCFGKKRQFIQMLVCKFRPVFFT